MEKVKKYFELDGKYKFDLMDLIAFLNIVGIVITMLGVPMATDFMLGVAVCGLINSFRYHRINLVLLNMGFVILDLYLLLV